MKKALFCMLALSLVWQCTMAQSKVFKEVSDEIASRVVAIRQDNELVGYLVFTQLEKVGEDSFHYKTTILDENLNDINTFEFREQTLYLQNVAIEQDVLCIAYIKSNVVGKTFKDGHVYRKYIFDHSSNNDILLQFMDLNGKLLNSLSIPLDVTFKQVDVKGGVRVVSSMREEVQLRNMPQLGFVLFYGDDSRNVITVYKPDGKRHWQQVIKENALDYFILPAKENIYLLMTRRGGMLEGDYQIACYSVKDSVVSSRFKVKGKENNHLRAVAFNTDPVTGMPFLSGYLVYVSPHDGDYKFTGLFTVNLKGHDDSDTQPVYSFWENGSSSPYKKSYSGASHSFKDFDGNAYFTGVAFEKDAKSQPSVLLKQDANGMLTEAASIPNSKKATGLSPAERGYSTVYNKETKSCYFIVDDYKSITIYDVSNKKAVRTIAHKDGDSRVNVFPAKEGHILVSEYNKKDKSTTISIEAL